LGLKTSGKEGRKKMRNAEKKTFPLTLRNQKPPGDQFQKKRAHGKRDRGTTTMVRKTHCLQKHQRGLVEKKKRGTRNAAVVKRGNEQEQKRGGNPRKEMRPSKPRLLLTPGRESKHKKKRGFPCQRVDKATTRRSRRIVPSGNKNTPTNPPPTI